MKIWTFLEMSTKVLTDFDLLDETWVSPNELSGYFNEAIKEAEAEILDTKEDYLKTRAFVPLVAGLGQYPLPYNIYANKIRDVIYSNGSCIYEVKRYRRWKQAIDIAFTDQYGQADDYRYDILNDAPGQAYFDMHPVSRETAILYPTASLFTPMLMRYIRQANRVPMVAFGTNAAEFCNPEVIATTQVSGNVITVNAGTTTYGVPQRGTPGGYPGSIAYVTGDIVQLQPSPGGSLPTGLTAGTSYYVIALTSTTISLATTLANALASTAITLSTVGVGYFILTVAATTAIVNASLIDIPEFAEFLMQWVKCRLLEKRKDPGLAAASSTLVAQKEQMVDTLTEAILDDDTTIQADFSHYLEMS
jgi:hypothetical protein